MAEIMTPHNDDGCGYTAVDEKGNIFGEKWLFNDDAFRNRKSRFTKPIKVDKAKLQKLREEFGDMGLVEEEVEVPAIEKYGTFGTLTKRFTAMTLHTRAASGEVCYQNIHPFVDLKESVSIVHNGYISNHDKEKDFIRSTCDSERILNKYIEHNLATNPVENIQKFIDSLKGSFAVGAFSKDKDGVRVLDIFRVRNSLGMIFVDELDTTVFATDINDVKKACKWLGWHTSSKIKLIQDDKLFRLDAKTGKPMINISFIDTTNRIERYWPTEDDGGDYMHGFHRNWEAEAKARREANHTGSQLSLVNNEVVKFTEAEETEIKEFVKTGMDRKEVEEMILEQRKERGQEQQTTDYRQMQINELMTEKGWSQEAATTFVDNQIRSANAAKEVALAKTIIQKAVDDPLNENEAANHGYFWDKTQGLWMKRKHGIN